MALTSSQNALTALWPFPSARSAMHASYALRSVSRSLPAVAKRALALIQDLSNSIGIMHCTHCDASSRLSMGLRNKGFDDKEAAMVRTGPRHWKMVPKNVSLLVSLTLQLDLPNTII